MKNNNQNDTSLHDLKQEYEAGVWEFEKTLPQDKLNELTGDNDTVGSPEHASKSRLVNLVKANNSTSKILRRTEIFKAIGYIGMLIVLFIKIIAIKFDVNFLLPEIVEIAGDTALITFSILGGLLILALTHFTADGFVNNKWKRVNRFALIVMFVVGLAATVYLNSRAVENYQKMVVEIKKSEKIENTNNINGIAVSNARDELGNIKSEMRTLNSDINKTKTDIILLDKSLASFIQIITEYATSAKHTKVAWLNKQTAEKSIKTITADIKVKKKELEAYKSELKLKKEEKKTLITSETDALKNLDAVGMDEKAQRTVILWVFLFIFEVLSFFGIIAEWLENNQTKDYIHRLGEIQDITEMGGVLDTHVNVLKADLLRYQAQRLSIDRKLLTSVGQAGVINSMETTKNIQDVIKISVVSNRAINKMGKMVIEQHLKYNKGEKNG